MREERGGRWNEGGEGGRREEGGVTKQNKDSKSQNQR